MKTNENGRSMVEMLGVLAIIGVLSVGAIAGYSKAMFKYKMNKTLDILSHAVNRVAELETMNLGNLVIDGASGGKKYGLFQDCDIDYIDARGVKGEACLLPLGDVWLTFESTESTNSIYGEFGIEFISEPFDSCIAFFNSDIYKNVPEDWWYPSDEHGQGGYIYVGGNMFYGKFEYALSEGGKKELTNTDIMQACESCKNVDYCSIVWVIRREL